MRANTVWLHWRHKYDFSLNNYFSWVSITCFIKYKDNLKYKSYCGHIMWVSNLTFTFYHYLSKTSTYTVRYPHDFSGGVRMIEGWFRTKFWWVLVEWYNLHFVIVFFYKAAKSKPGKKKNFNIFKQILRTRKFHEDEDQIVIEININIQWHRESPLKQHGMHLLQCEWPLERIRILTTWMEYLRCWTNFQIFVCLWSCISCIHLREQHSITCMY